MRLDREDAAIMNQEGQSPRKSHSSRRKRNPNYAPAKRLIRQELGESSSESSSSSDDDSEAME